MNFALNPTLVPIIAIDGPSASGKGTIARRLAKYYDFAYLDTGLLYRAAALLAAEAGVSPDDQARVEEFISQLPLTVLSDKLEDPMLRGDIAAVNASKVAAIPAVRFRLLKFQRDFADTPPDGKKGSILDGRDIGTVIAPEAPVKLFVTADVAVRAARRWKELHDRGDAVTLNGVLNDLRARDERDATREIAPSKPAPDAVIIDNSEMTPEQAFETVLKVVKQKL